MKKPLIGKQSQLLECPVPGEFTAANLPSRLGPNLIRDGRENGAVALQEGGSVRVGSVKVVGSVLGLQERQETTTDEGLSIEGGAQMVRAVAAGWDICDPEQRAKGVVVETVRGQEVYCFVSSTLKGRGCFARVR